jgi:hypothetical protein
VGNVVDLRPAEMLGQIADGLIKIQMGPAAGQQVSDVFSDCLV